MTSFANLYSNEIDFENPEYLSKPESVQSVTEKINLETFKNGINNIERKFHEKKSKESELKESEEKEVKEVDMLTTPLHSQFQVEQRKKRKGLLKYQLL